MYRPSPTIEFARYIFDTFVAVGALLEVNTPMGTKKVISGRLEEGVLASDIFDRMQLEVYGLMQSDSFLRFRKSEEYLDFSRRTSRMSSDGRYTEDFLDALSKEFDWFIDSLKSAV